MLERIKRRTELVGRIIRVQERIEFTRIMLLFLFLGPIFFANHLSDLFTIYARKIFATDKSGGLHISRQVDIIQFGLRNHYALIDSIIIIFFASETIAEVIIALDNVTNCFWSRCLIHKFLTALSLSHQVMTRALPLFLTHS